MPPYFVIKSLHLISLVAWFAGIFYIFRLFVYHRAHSEKKETAAVFSVMEGKLLKVILWPASLATAAFGAGLLYLNPALLQRGWLHAKLALVFLLFAYQIFSHLTWRRFRAGDYFLTERRCRAINEIPTLVLFAVVFLAVLKPAL
jgi:putative membrane protein